MYKYARLRLSHDACTTEVSCVRHTIHGKRHRITSVVETVFSKGKKTSLGSSLKEISETPLEYFTFEFPFADYFGEPLSTLTYFVQLSDFKSILTSRNTKSSYFVAKSLAVKSDEFNRVCIRFKCFEFVNGSYFRLFWHTRIIAVYYIHSIIDIITTFNVTRGSLKYNVKLPKYP